MELRNVDFEKEGKSETWQNTLRTRTRSNNKLSPHKSPSLGFEPQPQWGRGGGELGAVTTVPSLLPLSNHDKGIFI